MSDQEDIRQLQLTYATTFDSRDAEGFAALYTPDAEIVQHDGHVFCGHEKLRKAVRNMPPPSGGWHRIRDSEIVVDGDKARARCHYVARTGDGRFAEGHYDDNYLKTAQGWRIARRQVVIARWLEEAPPEPAKAG